MPLTDDELKAIGALMELKLQPVLDRMDRRDSEVNTRFDALIKQNADREREYLFMSEQLGRIEKKVDRYDQYLDNLDGRVTELEKKSA
jgi:predicted nuclease with TOPRIM domain